MKNLSVALLAVAALGTSVANASNGFYLGASAGVAQTNAKYDYSTINAVAVPAGVPSRASSASDNQQNFKASGGTGGLFGLFAGYGAVVGGGAYVGGEIYGGLDTTSFSPYDDSASGQNVGYWKAKVEHKYYYGLAARLGYMVTPSTLIYVRLAVESGKWKASVAPNAATIDANTVAGASQDTINNSKKTVTKSKSGLQFSPGAGVEIYVTKNLFLRAEYSYLFGPKLDVSHDSKAVRGLVVNGDGFKHNFKTSQHAMKIGVGYKF